MAFIQLHQTIDPLGIGGKAKILPSTVNSDNIERIIPTGTGSTIAFVSGFTAEFEETPGAIDSKLGIA